MDVAADRFVDLACLTYGPDESRARRTEAAALRAANPALVRAGVHAAAAAGDVAALRAHLDADPTGVERRGTPRDWVPLLALCYSRVPQDDAPGCLRLLLERGADPAAHVMLDTCRFTALTGVIGEGEAGPYEQPPHPDARAMAVQLLDAGADPNDSQGLYNTHFLASDAWLELLLARGLSSASDLDYVLGQAAVQGFAERARLLLAHGANPDGRNHYNRRCHVDNARLQGHARIVALLIGAGAKVAPLTDAERFRAAVAAGDADAARALLAVSPSAATDPAALITAARHGRLAAVQLALALGLPIDGRDHAGLTALHEAARNGHLDVVRELVSRGASLAVRDPRYGGTPLGHARHFAERWPRPHAAAIIELLERDSPAG